VIDDDESIMTKRNTLDDLSQQIKPRRRVPIWLVVMVGMVLLLGGGFGLYYFMPLDAPIPDGTRTRYEGLARGTTAQGFPRLGDPNAPILVEDFSSFSCPHCRDLHQEQFVEMLDRVEAGEVQVVFVPIPHIGMGAGEAAKGAMCAGEQGKFWEMSDALYHWQEEFRLRVFDSERLKNGAENLGLDTGQFATCMDDDHPAMVLDAARDEFQQRGLRGTPSVFVNGEQVSVMELEFTVNQLSE
jgi:protein-disulfide isomerase